MKFLIDFENLALAKRCLDILEKNEIPYEIVDAAEPGNPYLAETPDIHKQLFVYVNEKDWEKSMKLIASLEIPFSNKQPTENVFKRNYEAISFLCAALILIIIVISYKWKQTLNELKYYKDESLVDIQKTTDFCIQYTWKTTGQKAYRHCMTENSNFYSRTTTYNHQGSILFEGQDKNHDGLFECTSNFNQTGKQIDFYEDRNLDGFHEYLTLYFDTLTVQFHDKNEDGFFIESEIISKTKVKP
jgi:hypothetical protein